MKKYWYPTLTIVVLLLGGLIGNSIANTVN